MGNWSKPALPDAYPDFLDALNARDLDAGTMFLVDPTNPPVGIIRYNRSLNLFQEWNGSTWVNKVIAQAGGGTGAGSLPALGTMASQNANNVAITGGNITSLNNLNSNGDITGGGVIQANGELRGSSHLRINGQIVNGSGQVVLTNAYGSIVGLYGPYIADTNAQYLTNINANQLTHGTVYRDRLGSGAVGNGSKVLVDNGTWVSSNQIGGGMVEILHNDTSFGSGETAKYVSLNWEGSMPSSIKKVTVVLNTNMPNISFKVTAPNQFYIYNAPQFTIIDWTAYHHITQV